MNILNRDSVIKRCAMLMAGAGLALAATSTPAAEEEGAGPHSFEMVVLGDTYGGRQVLAGKISRVLDNALPGNRPSFDALTNHCVSLTLSGELVEAETACEAALSEANSKLDRLDSAFTPAHVKGEIRVRSAMALSNRGVLKALQGDSIGAREDFTEAWSLTQRVEAPKANLARLERANIVALVD